MADEQDAVVPDSYISIRFAYADKLEDEVKAYADEAALALYAEGRLKFLPVLDIEEERLVIRYYNVGKITGLVSFPTSLTQIENSVPSAMGDILEQVSDATDSLEQDLPKVPLAGEGESDDSWPED